MFGNDQTQQTSDNSDVPFVGAQPTNNGLMGLDSSTTDQPSSDSSASASPMSDTTPVMPAITNDAASDTSTSSPEQKNDELMDIKKEALMELSPLVNQLDQSADEKFETLMMMIQASDNKSLVPQAFESAKNISDDKKRARALLDVINEINYFNQKDKQA